MAETTNGRALQPTALSQVQFGLPPHDCSVLLAQSGDRFDFEGDRFDFDGDRFLGDLGDRDGDFLEAAGDRLLEIFRQCLLLAPSTSRNFILPLSPARTAPSESDLAFGLILGTLG